MSDEDDGRQRWSLLPAPLSLANETLAFLLELIALATLSWWGLHAGDGALIHVLLGVGAPVLTAVVWGLFAAPKARVRLPLAGVFAVKVLIFAATTAAIDDLGRPRLAVAFAIVAAINTVIATFDRRAAIRNRP